MTAGFLRTRCKIDRNEEVTRQAQAALELVDQCRGQPQGVEGLVEGYNGSPRLLLIALKTLVGFAATLGGFRMFFGVSCGWEHGELLCTVE